MRKSTIVLIGSCLFLSACGGTKGTIGSSYSRDLIVAEEIQITDANNAYDLVHKMRPHWLRARGRKSLNFPEASYPVVYINRSELGGIDSLYNIPVSNISEIRYLNAGDATTKYGSGHSGGAIEITTF